MKSLAEHVYSALLRMRREGRCVVASYQQIADSAFIARSRVSCALKALKAEGRVRVGCRRRPRCYLLFDDDMCQCPVRPRAERRSIHDETLGWVSAQEAPFTAPDMARALRVRRDVALKRLVRLARRGLVKRVGTTRRAHVRRPVVLWMRALNAAPSEGDPDG
jgi:hypothetical protein